MAAEMVRSGRSARRPGSGRGTGEPVRPWPEIPVRGVEPVNVFTIEGFVAPGFEPVRDAFALNFERAGDYREIGAALAAYRDRRLVVDLWGGFADGARTRPWRRDTLVNVWSATKAATATAIAVLVDRGLVDYDDKVALILPEVAQAGKAGVTVAQILSHQAGLPGFAEPTTIDDQLDFVGCVARLEQQTPLWTPGEETSYHAMTYGWLAGEIIRRTSGGSPGRFIAEAVAGPIGVDIFIGLPPNEEHRVAEITAPKREPDLTGPLSPAAVMALT